MKETIFRKATIYMRQEIEFSTQEERVQKIDEVESGIYLDLNDLHYGGNSEYEYRYNGLDEAKDDFPCWMFD